MSATASHTHHSSEALAQANGDPTRTTTLRRRYAQRLRSEFAEINTEIRRGVRDRDVFRLTNDSAVLADPIPIFRFRRDDQKAEAFVEWLRRQERTGVLQVVTRNNNTYIRSAYGRGLQHAATELRKRGIDVTVPQLQSAFALPVHEQALQLLFTRNFEELQGITEEMSRQIARELTEGFSQGIGPREMARNITDRVGAVGKHRATLLARTEVINAHSEATLNRYERLGIEEVTIRAELTTAGDRRVCPLCASVEGRTVTIREARTETFSFQASETQPNSLSGTYPIKPPIHPNCRCSWLPVTS